MSYTPTTWTTGDTVTASAMNKIEQGIAGAGSASFAFFWFPNSSLGWQVTGMDFETALAKLTGGEMILAVISVYSSTNYYGELQIARAITFSSSSIYLYFTDSTFPYLQWTENGITYVND